MTKTAKGYLVNHSHWDREWYFSAMDSIVLSDQIFTDVLDELEKNEKASFCLDGQSSVLEDYLGIYPEKRELVEKLLKNAQLFTGPWYAQTDGLIPSGEAILRNLMIGTRDANRMGKSMPIGYLPDTFGFNAQFPTILQHAGLDNILFWRGSEIGAQLPSPYFKWKGLGNKEIIGANIPQSYSAASMIEAKEDYAKNRIDTIIDLHLEHGEDEVLFPAGSDQSNVVPDFSEVVERLSEFSKYDLEASTYPEFMERLRQRELQTYQGDFRIPKYTRLHRSIGSVRFSIKDAASKVQEKLVNEIEPLIVLAKHLGIHISTELLVKTWKKLLESQAHDSLGGCVTDSVAQDILHRLKEADELCDGIKNTILFRLHESLGLGEQDLLLLNPKMKEFSDYQRTKIVLPSKNFSIEGVDELTILSEKYYPVRKNVLMLTAKGHEYIDEPAYYVLDIQFKVTLASFGYSTLHINVGGDDEASGLLEGQGHSIENEYVKLNFENQILSLQTNGQSFEDFLRLTDQGNDGDTYDFSPLREDRELTLDWLEASVSKIGQTQILTLKGQAQLPEHLAGRVNFIDLKKVDYQVKLSIQPNSPRINGEIKFDNHIYSHRLRLKIKTGIANTLANAQIQVGFQKRENQDIPENWRELYVEKPVNLFNFQKTVTHTDEENNNVTFFAKNLYEYEIADESMYITLLATTGQFGKPDLAWRPGRASGDTTNAGNVMIDTPDAEEIGEYINEFALTVLSDWSEEKIISEYENWSEEAICYQKQSLNRSLNRLDNKLQKPAKTQSLPNYKSVLPAAENVKISSITPSLLDKDAYLVRLVNESKNPVDFSQAFTQPYEIVNALEEKQAGTKVVEAYDYVTLKFHY